jgi:hypothetical protein
MIKSLRDIINETAEELERQKREREELERLEREKEEAEKLRQKQEKEQQQKEQQEKQARQAREALSAQQNSPAPLAPTAQPAESRTLAEALANFKSPFDTVVNTLAEKAVDGVKALDTPQERWGLLENFQDGLTFGTAPVFAGIGGGINAAINGNDFLQGFDKERKRFIDERDDYRNNHQFAAGAARFTGGGIASAGIPAGQIVKAASFGKKVFDAAKIGAGYAAADSAGAEFAGRYDNTVGNKLKNIGIATGFGGISGAAAPYLSKVTGLDKIKKNYPVNKDIKNRIDEIVKPVKIEDVFDGQKVDIKDLGKQVRQNLAKAENGRPYVFNAEQNVKADVPNSFYGEVQKSVAGRKSLDLPTQNALNNFQELFEKSAIVKSHADTHSRDGIAQVHRHIAPMSMGDDLYAVKFTTRELDNKNNILSKDISNDGKYLSVYDMQIQKNEAPLWQRVSSHKENTHTLNPTMPRGTDSINYNHPNVNAADSGGLTWGKLMENINDTSGNYKTGFAADMYNTANNTLFNLNQNTALPKISGNAASNIFEQAQPSAPEQNTPQDKHVFETAYEKWKREQEERRRKLQNGFRF